MRTVEKKRIAGRAGLFLAASALFLAAPALRASWYVDASTAAAHLGGSSRYGPFATLAEAQAFVDRESGYGMSVIPGGSDDAPGGGGGGVAAPGSAEQLGTQLGNIAANAIIQGFKQASQEMAVRNAQIQQHNAAIAQDIEEKKKEAAEEKARLAAAEAQDSADAFTRLQGRLKGTQGGGLALKPIVIAPAGKVGTDTKAGDQLLSAAATARAKGDLSINFDAGGGAAAGSLERPSVPPVVITETPAMSERVAKDPRMVKANSELSDLQAKRSQLEQARDEAVKERNSATDPAKMADLSTKAQALDAQYQANLKAISDKQTSVDKLHREIDTEVEDAPAPAAPAKP